MFKCIYCDEECSSIKNLTQHLNQCLKNNSKKDREQIKTTKYTKSEISNKVSKDELSRNSAEDEDQIKSKPNINERKDKQNEESRKETKPNHNLNISKSNPNQTKLNIYGTRDNQNMEFGKETKPNQNLNIPKNDIKETKPNIDKTKCKENEESKNETKPNLNFFENNPKTDLEETKPNQNFFKDIPKTNLEETNPKQNVDPEYICKIMVEEFIKYFWQFDSFCVALICNEQFKKLDFKSQIKYGVIVYGDDYGNQFAESHFWNEIEDKKFDPWKEIEMKKNRWLKDNKTVYYPEHKLYPLKLKDLEILKVYFKYLVTDCLEDILDLPMYLLIKGFMKEIDRKMS